MTVAANLLCKLLNYVIEQSKVVDPHGFKLTGHKGFLKNREALSVDVTRFNRHLLRSKLNWSDSHEDSEIPGRIQG